MSFARSATWQTRLATQLNVSREQRPCGISPPSPFRLLEFQRLFSPAKLIRHKINLGN